MKRTVAVFLASVLTAHAYAFAAEPQPPNPTTSSVQLHPFGPTELKRSVTLQVARLGTPLTPGQGLQSAQPQNSSKERGWCRRHPVLCGTAIGYPVGFVVGVASSGDMDYDPSAYGLFFGGPIGAGIGATIGGIIGGIR